LGAEPELARTLGMTLEQFYELTNETCGLGISRLQCEMMKTEKRIRRRTFPVDEDPLTLC
jgi:hypothetical protein